MRGGEILGVAGAEGNGQLELLRALARVDHHDGTVTIGSTAVRSYRDATDHGLIYLSGDRASESLLAALNVRENLAIGRAGEPGPVSASCGASDEVRHADELIERYGIRVGSREQTVTSLSGGNQQKVAISRVLCDRAVES